MKKSLRFPEGNPKPLQSVVPVYINIGIFLFAEDLDFIFFAKVIMVVSDEVVLCMGKERFILVIKRFERISLFSRHSRNDRLLCSNVESIHQLTADIPGIQYKRLNLNTKTDGNIIDGLHD